MSINTNSNASNCDLVGLRSVPCQTDLASISHSIDNPQLFAHLTSPLANICASLIMASLWGLFSYRHIAAFYLNNDWTYLLIAASETLSAAFFLFRSVPKSVSNDPFDWLFGIAGTFTPLLFIPAPWGALPIAKNLIVFGLALQILGLISLNRSLAIIAAKRQIKTSAMYRVVRHPIYAGYLFIFSGYVLANTTIWNSVIYTLTMGLLCVRINREEKHLLLDPLYGKYVQRVRWRILPFMY